MCIKSLFILSINGCRIFPSHERQGLLWLPIFSKRTFALLSHILANQITARRHARLFDKKPIEIERTDQKG